VDEANLAYIVERLRSPSIAFEQGLSPSEVSSIEDRYVFRFPPDLKAFLQYALPVSTQFPDWRNGKEYQIRDWLDWPMKLMLDDIEDSGCWMDVWGPRPSTLDDALAVARREVASAPRLIPVLCSWAGIFYLPNEPELSGNPVLSYEGYSNTWYRANDDLVSHFRYPSGVGEPRPAAATRRPVRFWDDAIELWGFDPIELRSKGGHEHPAWWDDSNHPWRKSFRDEYSMTNYDVPTGRVAVEQALGIGTEAHRGPRSKGDYHVASTSDYVIHLAGLDMSEEELGICEQGLFTGVKTLLTVECARPEAIEANLLARIPGIRLLRRSRFDPATGYYQPM
jgi:hypothetical protein